MGPTPLKEAIASWVWVSPYQWKKNDTLIQGANQATLKISNLQLEDAGFYTCTITDTSTPTASITSDSATLVVKTNLGFDVNNDGDVDVRDMANLTRSLGKTLSDPDWSTHVSADLNEDGQVNDEDIVVLLSKI